MTFAQIAGLINFKQDFCGRYLTDQACTVLAYKKKSEEKKALTLWDCTFDDVDHQISYLFGNHNNRWWGDWKLKRLNFEQYTTFSFSDWTFTITKKSVPSPSKGVD